jgi:voltage-gated potassium channel
MIAPATAAVRRRLYELLDHGGIGDRAAALVGRLIVINLVAVTLESVPALHAEYGALFTAVEFLSLVAFTIEYGLRAWVAPEHPAYRHQSAD